MATAGTVSSSSELREFKDSEELENLFISAGCNSEYEVCAWSGPFLVQSSSNLVTVTHVPGIKTLCALAGHPGRVNNVKVLENGELLSICSKGKVLLRSNTHFPAKNDLTKADAFMSNPAVWNHWVESSSLEIKGRNFIHASVLNLGERGHLAAISSTESDLTLLHILPSSVSGNRFVVMDQLLFGNNLLECSTLFAFGGEIYLWVGASDFLVHVYTLEKGVLGLGGDKFTPNTEQNGAGFKFLNSLKGHEDKVKSLASAVVDSSASEAPEVVALVASGSKDSSIRVWRLTESLTEDIKSQFLKKNIYRVGKHFAHLESNLREHSDAVSSVEWGLLPDWKARAQALPKEADLCLLSSSFDLSVQIWQREATQRVWMNNARLGQLGGNKNSFYGATFSHDLQYVAANNFSGCVYLWKNKGDMKDWEIAPIVTGHNRPVSTVDWGGRGSMLLSASLDQTSRIYSPRLNVTLPADKKPTWHEVSRSQVHGYDIQAAKFLAIPTKPTDDPARRHCELIVCGADEKILRLLEPPASVVNTVNKFTGSKLRLVLPSDQEASLLDDPENVIYKTKTEAGATVLGLLVKAAPVVRVSYYSQEEGEGGEDADEPDIMFDIPYDFSTPPIEDYLYKHSLWPEINKLYGHGFELLCVETHPSGRLIASTCKSQTSAHSAIFLWNPETVQPVQKLEGHNYSVLQIRFSKTGKYLAAVSRDRQTSLFREAAGSAEALATGKISPNQQLYDQVFLQTTHDKMIYAVSICPRERYLAAGGRDKTLKVWRISTDSTGADSLKEVAAHKLHESISSLEFASDLPATATQTPLWVGFDDGRVELYLLTDKPDHSAALLPYARLSQHQSHGACVKNIRCHPLAEFAAEGEKTKAKYKVASAAEDHSVRLYEYTLHLQ